MLCGAGVIVVGFVPEDSTLRIHAAGAAMHFLCGGLGVAVVGWSLRRRASVLAGVCIVAATVLLGQSGSGLVAALGVGTVERVAAYGIAGWMAGMGVSFWLQKRQPA